MSSEPLPPTVIAPGHDPRTCVLLEAPIMGTLLNLGAPNMIVMLVQASIGLIEVYFIGKLGTETCSWPH